MDIFIMLCFIVGNLYMVVLLIASIHSTYNGYETISCLLSGMFSFMIIVLFIYIWVVQYDKVMAMFARATGGGIL